MRYLLCLLSVFVLVGASAAQAPCGCFPACHCLQGNYYNCGCHPFTYDPSMGVSRYYRGGGSMRGELDLGPIRFRREFDRPPILIERYSYEPEPYYARPYYGGYNTEPFPRPVGPGNGSGVRCPT